MASRSRSNDDADCDRTVVGLNTQTGSQRRDRAHLLVLAGSGLGRMVPIDRPETVIGRSADATIQLQDDGVSRRHARIVILEDALYIEDLGSANGTLVNGQRVTRVALCENDKIQIGPSTIVKFIYADELEENFQQKMYNAALYDHLTKACNKRHLLDRLETEASYAKRHKTPLSLLMLDIDHFKQVNDRHGHLAGDHVLSSLATVIRETIRTEDLFARYGGEEFAILCRGTTVDAALLLAERLRSKVERSVFEHEQQRIPVTISIGVAAWSERPDSTTELISGADGALYKAKRTGRNRVVVKGG